MVTRISTSFFVILSDNKMSPHSVKYADWLNLLQTGSVS